MRGPDGPNDTVAPIRGTVTLTCVAVNKTGHLLWLHNDDRVISKDDRIIAADDRYEIVGDGDSDEYSLKIHNLTASDQGTYRCLLTKSDNHGQVVPDAAQLNVVDTELQTFIKTPTSITTAVGFNVTFECAVANKVGTLIWFIDGSPVSADERVVAYDNRYSIVVGQSQRQYNLNIHRVVAEDSGIYQCVVTQAANNPRIESSVVRLTVNASSLQSFLVEPSSVILLEDSNHTLQCSVSDKEGVVIWQKDGEPLNSDYILNNGVSSRIYQVEAPTNVGVEYNLIIKSVTSEEAGTYTCTVTAAGSSSYLMSRAATVIVIQEQTISQSPTSRVGQPGDNITLQCETRHKVGYLKWYRSQDNQQSLKKISTDTSMETAFSDRYSIIGDQANGEYILQICNLQNSDAGQYSCHLTEEGVQGYVWSTPAELKVITSPELLSHDSMICRIEMRNDTLYLGDTVLFTCEFQGVGSLPGLQWSKDEQPIQQMNMDSPSGVKVGFQLSVSENEDGVTYACTASHATFSEPKTCNIGPLKIEWIKKSPKSATVFPYGTITLECQIGRKIGSVVWYKDGVAISSDTTITNGNSRYRIAGDHSNEVYNLLINDIQADDTGFYQCGMVKSTIRRRNRSVEGRSESAYLHVDTITPHLYMVPADRVSREGYSVEIKCAIVNKEVNSQLLWYQDDILISTDRDVEEGYSNRFSITGNADRGEYFLKIEPLFKSDAGVYKCQSTGSQSKSSLPVQLTLRDAQPPSPDYPACSGPTEDDLQTCGNVTITCMSRGGDPMPTLVWQHDNDQLVPDFTVYDYQSVSESLQLVLTSDLQGATFTCSSDHVTFAQPKECTIGPLNFKCKKNQALVISLSVIACVALIFVIVVIVMKFVKDCKCTSAKKVEDNEVTDDSHSANTGDSAVPRPGKYIMDIIRYSQAAETVGPQRPKTFYPHHTEGYEYNDEKSDKSAKAKRRLHNRNVVAPQNVEETPVTASTPKEATVARKQGEEEIDKDDRKGDDRETFGRFSEDDVSNGSGDLSYAGSYQDERGGRRQSGRYNDEGYRRPYSDGEDSTRRIRNIGEYDDGSHHGKSKRDYDVDKKERQSTGRRDDRTDREGGSGKHAHFADEHKSKRTSGRKVGKHIDPQGERGVRDHVEDEYANVQKHKGARDAIHTSNKTHPYERETSTKKSDKAKQHRDNDADVLVSKHRGDKTGSEEGEKSEHSKRSASPADDAGTYRPEATTNNDIWEASQLYRGGDGDIEMREITSTKDDKPQSRLLKKKSKKKRKKKENTSCSSSSSSDSSSDEEIKLKKKKGEKHESSRSSSESNSDMDDEKRAKSKNKEKKQDESDRKGTKHKLKSRDSKDETKTRQRDRENADKSESHDMDAANAKERTSGSREKPKKKRRRKSQLHDNDEDKADSRGESAVRDTDGDDVMAGRDNIDENTAGVPLNDHTGGTTSSVVNETDDRDQETDMATANDGVASGSHGDRKHKKSKKKKKK
ncbi:uncharacterized protein [Ptychodera flava]|uniref:uncharacterized protein n=1 Tax=Ptychodera flava TaxID=63121 RepID=UPI00396A579C